jgi:Polysaccharide deacetylase
MAATTFSAHRDAIRQGQFLRVVNYHNTPGSGREALRSELARYAQRFHCVTLDELDEFFETGRWRGDRPGFIPVFYEGYRTSYEVAAPVCDELGLTAWFPICTGFVDCPPEQQEAFARSHWIGLVAEDLEKRFDRLALSWDEIAELSQRHVVTPHTASHDGTADVNSEEDFEREVFAPKRKMDAVTGRSAPAFAWLHGTQWGTSERHDRALQAAGYRYQISNTMLHRIA